MYLRSTIELTKLHHQEGRILQPQESNINAHVSGIVPLRELPHESRCLPTYFSYSGDNRKIVLKGPQTIGLDLKFSNGTTFQFCQD